jgi:hypothetical protein
MNGMPFDMVLSQPLAETFGAQGFAPNIAAAHNMSWDALKTALGEDPTAGGSSRLVAEGHAARVQP